MSRTAREAFAPVESGRGSGRISAAQDATSPYPVVCQRAGNSTRSDLRSQRARSGQEDVLERMVRGQQQANAARVAQHRSADLEQLDADGGRAC